MKNKYLVTVMTLVLACLNLVVSAQETQKPSTDSVLSKKVAGVWLVDEYSNSGKARGTGSINLATNGDYTFELKTMALQGPAKGDQSTSTSTGKWMVKDGSLWISKMKIHSSLLGDKVFAKPIVTSSKIVRVNDQELVCTSTLGKTEQTTTTTWKRGK